MNYNTHGLYNSGLIYNAGGAAGGGGADMLIGEVSYSEKADTLNINDNINDRSTGSFIIQTTASLTIGSSVVISDDGTTIFGGTIENFKLKKILGTDYKEYSISCIDFNQISDRIRVAETYESKTAQYIFDDIVTTYLAADGVTMGTYPATTPIISKANFNYTTVAECFQFLQEATGLNWNIDYDKNLNIFYKEDNIDTGFSDALGNILDIEVDQSRESYRNIQWLKAGDGTTATQDNEIPTPEPDGKSKSFFVRFPFSKKPTVIVNSVTISTSSVGINGLDTGMMWYWNKNENKLVHDDGESVLISSDSLEVTYQGLLPILIRLENEAEQTVRQSIEGGTGMYEHFEAKAGIDERSTAISYASGLLDKYDKIPQKISIRTRTFKTAGKIVPVTVSDLGITGDYLIESVSITTEDNIFFYQIELLSGESFGSWVEFFRRMTLNANDFIVQENEVVIRVKSDTEIRNRSGQNDVKALTALFPADDLYPDNDLYPGTIQGEVTYND